MQHDPMTMFCQTDLAGQDRGKGFPSRQIEKRLKGGIGWTPNNLMFTALGTIAPGFWGSHRDVMLMPDQVTGVEVDFGDGPPSERFYLCDVLNTDGPRGIAAQGLCCAMRCRSCWPGQVLS